jgi:hypothetical protein
MERITKGLSSGDAMLAKNASREVDTTIDAIFPPLRTVMNKQTAAERITMLKEIQKLLLKGDPKIVPLGKRRVLNAEGRHLMRDANPLHGPNFTEETFLKALDDGKFPNVKTKDYVEIKRGGFKAEFGDLDPKLKKDVAEKLMKAGAKDEQIKSIYANLSAIRTRWSDLFTKLGRTLEPDELKQFKEYFGDKFSGYLGATYDIFQNKSIIPWLRYKPAAEAIDETKQVFKDSYALANPGKVLGDLEAEQYVADILEEGGHMLPKGMRMDKPTDAIFKVPDFFVNRTVLKETTTKRGSPLISAGDIKDPEIVKTFR